MKNLLVGSITIVILSLMVLTFQRGPAFQGAEAGKVIEDIETLNESKKTFQQIEEKSDRQKEDEKLNALRNKAGSMSAFKVSDKYRSKCASCHGVNGTGEQNGKKLMGPKLFGQSKKEIYEALIEFKSGRKENTVMRGLLLSLDDQDMKELAKEISEFKARAEALK